MRTPQGGAATNAVGAVPKIEGELVDYIDIKDSIINLRKTYGDKSRLKLMDNNVLASQTLEELSTTYCSWDTEDNKHPKMPKQSTELWTLIKV